MLYNPIFWISNSNWNLVTNIKFLFINLTTLSIIVINIKVYAFIENSSNNNGGNNSNSSNKGSGNNYFIYNNRTITK
jgi:hypothetical protein